MCISRECACLPGVCNPRPHLGVSAEEHTLGVMEHTPKNVHISDEHIPCPGTCVPGSTPMVMHTQVCAGTQASVPRCVRAQGCTSSGLLACPDPGIPLGACKTRAFACACRCKPDDSGATACPQTPFKCMQALCNQIFMEIYKEFNRMLIKFLGQRLYPCSLV